jgi:hypothetical protein
MRPLIKTEADALALIAATYSDPRPDIHEPLALDQWQGWEAMIWEAPATEVIASFLPLTLELHTWDPGEHLEYLEEYHEDNLGEKGAKKRQAALRRGAALTQEETDALVCAWDETADGRDVLGYTVFRVGPPFLQSDETRSIYFLCRDASGAQHSDLLKVIGSLRSLDEILEFFPIESRDTYLFDASMTKGEGEDLQRRFFPQAT